MGVGMIKKAKVWDYWKIQDFFNLADEGIKKFFYPTLLRKWYFYLPAVFMGWIEVFLYKDEFKRVVGIATTKKDSKGEVNMSFGVRADYRGEGIGRALFEEITRGDEDYILFYDEENKRVAPFYESMGCVEVGKWIKMRLVK